MAATLDQSPTPNAVAGQLFFRTLRQSRLLPPNRVDELEVETLGSPLATIRRKMLTDGILTAYQLGRIAAGLPDGMVFGQYRVLGVLGEGGCGKVFRAKHALTDRVVALKVINPSLHDNEIVRNLFLREVIATTRLNHPNIATAFHADEADGQVFLAIEHVDGPTLQGFVAGGGPLNVPLACDILIQTGRALQHAHELGMVHRDIKPANIMLWSGPGGVTTVKVIDFGLARQRTVDCGVLKTIPCQEGAVIGTPAFIAPEQITHVHNTDIRADLYSLGCTLYFALAGRLPFTADSSQLVLCQHLSTPPDPITSLRPAVPPEVARIIHRLMEKDPADRYQTPNEMIEAVEDYLLSLSSIPVPEPIDLRPAAPPADEVPTAPMDRPATISDLSPTHPTPVVADDLPDLWAEWLTVLGGVVHRKPATVTEGGYKELYRQLVRSGRAVASDPAHPLHEWAVEALVAAEPWVSRKSLEGLDRHTMGQLWDRCQRLGGETTSPEAEGRTGWTVWALVPVVMGLAALVVWWMRWR